MPVINPHRPFPTLLNGNHAVFLGSALQTAAQGLNGCPATWFIIFRIESRHNFLFFSQFSPPGLGMTFAGASCLLLSACVAPPMCELLINNKSSGFCRTSMDFAPPPKSLLSVAANYVSSTVSIFDSSFHHRITFPFHGKK